MRRSSAGAQLLLLLVALGAASVPMGLRMHNVPLAIGVTLLLSFLGCCLHLVAQPPGARSGLDEWRGVAASAAAGLVTYALAFAAAGAGAAVASPVMMGSFLFACPLAMGAVCVIAGTPEQRSVRRYAILEPAATGLFACAALWLLRFEGTICVVMAWPAITVLAACGGLIAHYFLQGAGRKTGIVCALVPLALGPLEAALPAPRPELRRVENDVVVEAPASRVWQEVRSVPRIQDSERRLTLAHAIGFPRPVAADLTGEGVGAYRTATFEGGVVFKETIESWKPGAELSFSIKAQPVPPSTLDEHVTIGGPYFDVLRGRYRLAPLGPRRTLVRLDSEHRLSTRFNFYSGLWTDFIMGDIQADILRIVKARCER